MAEPIVRQGKPSFPLALILKEKRFFLNKVLVEVIETNGIKKLTIDGRIIEDILISKDGAILFIEHYTSRESANKIRAERFIKPGDDRFAYFGERLRLYNKDFIKQVLSASNAEIRITIQTSPIAIERIWLNCERKFPYFRIGIEFGLYPKKLLL